VLPHDEDMASSSYALKAQSDAFLAGMRGARQRSIGGHEHFSRTPTKDHLHLVEPLPRLIHPPTTRRITSKGRVQARIANAPLAELLGWMPGSLETSLDGAWVVLHAPEVTRRARRFDGSCALEPTGRIRLSLAALHHLSLEIGDEVALLALPHGPALALINPSFLLLAAPLELATTPARPHQQSTEPPSDPTLTPAPRSTSDDHAG